jgi:thiamine pyrophosphate-dependent acetolactate synthase large subunit-like protein
MSFLWCVNGNSFLISDTSTEMTNPNFVAIAEGYYIKAKGNQREDLDAAVAE